MDCGALYQAGLAMGRAQMLGVRRDPQGVTELQEAIGHLRELGLEEEAQELEALGDFISAPVVSCHINSIQAQVKLPSQHAFDAGINLGNAHESAWGTHRSDVQRVIMRLKAGHQHLSQITPLEDSEENAVETVIEDLQSLLEAGPAGAKSLPEFKSRIGELVSHLGDGVR